MDIVHLRKEYGNRLAIKGGIDKHVLRQGKDAILKELEYKLQPLMRQGGMVFGLDHRIPSGTPLEAYRYYVKTAREILGLPSKWEVDGEGWLFSNKPPPPLRSKPRNTFQTCHLHIPLTKRMSMTTI